MARTVFVGLPYSAEFPAANFPQMTLSNRRPALAFDASTAEACQWTTVAPVGLTGTLTAKVLYAMASATSGGVAFTVEVEAITPGDAVDTDTADSFDSVNTGTDATVPATAGYVDTVSITLTNADSIAAGDLVRFRLTRAVANAADTATGDCLALAIEIQDAG
jgi:hypothetical protein